MEPLRPDDPPRIGPFTPLARIGSGGMGRVYLARSRGGRPVAVKVIRSEFADDPRFRTRFRREVEAARTVGGLYTASVLDAGPDDANPWLATAYIAGPSLQQLISNHGPLPERSARILGAYIAEALGAIHAAGLIHRDLKPSNVICGPDGPRVIDFGISHAVGGTSLTATGLVVGSPRYASPEQCRADAEALPASDVFALGGVLVYATTGLPPFGEGPDHVQLYLVVHEQPDLAAVPAALRPIVAACLDKDPASRPTVDRLLDELLPPDEADHLIDAGQDWLPVAVGNMLSSYAIAGTNTPVNHAGLAGLTGFTGPTAATQVATHQRPELDPVSAAGASHSAAGPAALISPNAGDESRRGVPSTAGGGHRGQANRAASPPTASPTRRRALIGVAGLAALAASGGGAWWAATNKGAKPGAAPGPTPPTANPGPTASTPTAPTAATSTPAPPDPNGALWSVPTDLTWGHGALVRAGRLVGIHQNAASATAPLTLIALHSSDGTPAWQQPLPPDNPAASLPLAADDLAVYSYAAGNVTAWRLTDGKSLWTLPTGLPVAGDSGRAPESAILGLVGGVLFVGVAQPDAGSQLCLVCVDVSARRILWSRKSDDLRQKLPAGLTPADATVVITVPRTGALAFLSVSDAVSARQVKALKPTTGEEAWTVSFAPRTQNTSPQIYPTVSATSDAVYLTDMHSGYLHAYDAAGKWKWTYPHSQSPDASTVPGTARFTGRVSVDFGVVYASDATSVHAFDAAGGQPVPGWSAPAAFPAGLRGVPVVAGGQVWGEADTPTAKAGPLTLFALDPANGRVARQIGLTSSPTSTDPDALVSDQNTLFVVAATGGVQAYGPSH